jgi:quercetin dioxygenase-like cupin family protein
MLRCHVATIWIAASIGFYARFGALSPTASGKGQKTCEKLFEDEKVRVARCTFPPGVGHERHFHLPHYLYVLGGGRVRVTDATGTREADVTTGIFRANPRIEWHEILNIGDTTLQYLLVEPK